MVGIITGGYSLAGKTSTITVAVDVSRFELLVVSISAASIVKL